MFAGYGRSDQDVVLSGRTGAVAGIARDDIMPIYLDVHIGMVCTLREWE
jgi:hypothetical protein